jgi:hypothetical protein
MRLTTLALTAMTALIGAAQAEPVPPVRPYARVDVAPPEPFEDASFEAFRHELAAVARRRVYAELARLTATQGFFWVRDFARAFDPHRPAVDNLAAAVRLEHGAGTGWNALAAFAAESAAAPLPAHPGAICAPRQPRFDETEFDRLIRQSGVEPIAWAYPNNDSTALRAAPNIAAATIETLGRTFVRLLGANDAGRAAVDRVPAFGDTQWAAVAAPSGKSGFVAPGALLSLASPRLCYAKDEVARWRIIGYIGAGD